MDGDGNDEEKCKVMVRSLLLAFRSLSVLEKTVDSCIWDTGSEECKLLVSLNCRHSVNKQFQLGLVDCEALRAVYDTTRCSNKWIISSKVMQEANGNFLSNQEEVTMHVNGNSFKMKNYNDDYDEKKHVHSQLSMLPGEFEYFSINEETSITFCLKELRSLLAFAEYLQLPITAEFSQGGQPLVLTVSQGQAISCTYVLATLAEEGNIESLRTGSLPNPPGSTVNSSQTVNNRLHSTQRDTPGLITPTLSPNVSSIPREGPGLLQTTVDNSLNMMPPPVDFIDGSPPSKKKNFLFRRCFDATFNPQNIPGTERVLAPDSDEEN